MKIKFLGGSTFLIKTGETTILLDPTSDSALKQKKTETDICIVTDNRYADAGLAIQANPNRKVYTIDGQGEYEVGGVYAKVSAYHGKAISEDKDIIVKIRAEDITILYLGYANTALTKEELKNFNDIDILIAPVGNGSFISHEAVDTVISSTDPYVLITSLFKEGGAQSGISDLAPLEDFLKHLGTKEAEREKTLTIKSDDFDDEAEAPMRIVALDRE